jgi:hypothetical protein
MDAQYRLGQYAVDLEDIGLNAPEKILDVKEKGWQEGQQAKQPKHRHAEHEQRYRTEDEGLQDQADQGDIGHLAFCSRSGSECRHGCQYQHQEDASAQRHHNLPCNLAAMALVGELISYWRSRKRSSSHNSLILAQSIIAVKSVCYTRGHHVRTNC